MPRIDVNKGSSNPEARKIKLYRITDNDKPLRRIRCCNVGRNTLRMSAGFCFDRFEGMIRRSVAACDCETEAAFVA